MGSRRLATLLQSLGSAQAVWKASLAELQHAGLSSRLAEKLLQHCQQTDARALYERYLQQGIQFCFREDAHYPAWLKQIFDPPFILYWQGHRDCWQALEPALGLVGTRQPTPYGLEQARHLARELAGAGVAVISGLAAGIDTAAHQGALEGGGWTVAVLGHGLNRMAGADKRRLAQQIQARGLVLSEFPPDFVGTRWSFPLRNRIISGMAQGVLVVEAAPRSGALITADAALEQGREVLALPGLVSVPQSAGPHALIQQGAQLVTCTPDIFRVMGWKSLEVAVQPESLQKGLTNQENEVYLILNETPQPVEDLSEQLSWPVGRILSVLTQLELKGIVHQWPGARFSRTDPTVHSKLM